MSRNDHRRQTRSPKRSQPAQGIARVTAPSAVFEGVRFLQQGDLERAEVCFERAMMADPRDAVARNCLGIVARAGGRLAEAMAFFHKSLELQPQFAEAHNNLGNVFRDTGSNQRAAECYRKALSIKPAFPEAHNNLGVTTLSEGDLDESIACFEEALRLQPNYAEAHNNLATAYYQRGEFIAAAANLEAALQIKPGSPEIHNNLANILCETGQLELALRHYQQAIELKPDFADAHDNFGTVLIELDRPDDAIAAYQRALQLQSDRPQTLLNLGNAYRLSGRIPDAQRTYQQIAAIEPQNLWHQIRVAALCPAAYRSHQELHDHRRRALESWPLLSEQRQRLGSLPLNSRLAEPAFAWQFLDGNLRPLKEAFANIFGEGWRRHSARTNLGRPRIGIIVTRGHEGLFLRSLGGVLERLSTARFDVAIVCPNSSEHVIRRGLNRDVELVLMPADFIRSTEVIQHQNFDVLYFWEIGTDATNYFLPFLQLAPVQCTSWGVQLTSGNRFVDFYLGSGLVEPNDAAEHYTERLLLSPNFLTYQTPPELREPIRTRADFGFKQHQHLYVCAQQLGKFHPDFDSLIAGILRQDGAGVFVGVQDRQGIAAGIVRTRFEESYFDVADRFVLLPRQDFDTYLQLLNIADVLLDPPHFGGVNSTYDAVAVRQLIVTMPTEYHRGRYSAACLKRVEVTETIARDAEDYVRLAVSLANDPMQRAELRQRLRRSSQQLFRDDSSVREHERHFEFLLEEAERRKTLGKRMP